MKNRIKERIKNFYYDKEEVKEVFGEVKILTKRIPRKRFSEDVFVDISESVKDYNENYGPLFSNMKFYKANFKKDEDGCYEDNCTPIEIGSLRAYFNHDNVSKNWFKNIMDMDSQQTYNEASFYPNSILYSNTLYLINVKKGHNKEMDKKDFLAMISFLVNYKQFDYLYLVTSKEGLFTYKNIRDALPTKSKIINKNKEFNSYLIKLF